MAGILGVKVEEIEEIAPYIDAFEGTVTRVSPSVKLESLKPDVKAFVSAHSASNGGVIMEV